MGGALLTGALLGFHAAAEETGAGRWELDLSGQKWQMEGIRPGQGGQEGFAALSARTFNWNEAEVPGDVYTDLWRAGQIDDPHYGRNGMKAKWAMELEWWYRRRFTVPEAVQGDVVRLVFEGVDYACDVWLNGKHLGRHEGMFSPFEFEVSSTLLYGDQYKGGNDLVVRLDPPPRNYREVAGRKFEWSGDYWRTLTPMGIRKPVRLVATGPIQIKDVYPTTRIHDDGSATVELQITLAHSDPPVANGARVRAVVRGANFESEPLTAELEIPAAATGGVVTLSLRIEDAKLWWPWDLGAPNLYTVESMVVDASRNISDRDETRFGIREIRMERNPGYTEEEVKYPWTMMINGRREFLRSASWGGPPDIFYGRNSPEKYQELVELAREANVNNLRIFGWHPPEVDLFYELCDEMGITVWQDLIPLASVNVPQDEAFRDATYAEAVAVIKTLRSHPSLVLLEGGEEIFYASYVPQGPEYSARFLLGLEDAIRPYTTLPYIPTSPLSWPPIVHELGLGGPKDSSHPHGVFYSIGSHLIEDDVKKWDYAAIPEFGITSAPNVGSIRKFIPPEELWPPGPSWGYHWADLDELRNVNYQIFGDERTGSLDDFVEATQIAQGTIFQFGIEHIRRRKPKSSAIAICHFITFSPDFKWGIVDYFQETKRSFDFVKRAFQPLLVSLQHEKRRWLPGENFTGSLWIVNDLMRDYADCVLTVEITDEEGNRQFRENHAVPAIAADSSVSVAAVNWKVDGHVGENFRVSLVLQAASGETLSANHYDMLLGNQEQAREECAKRAAAFRSVRDQFAPADYFRYFPGLSGEERFNRMGDTPAPADGFSPAHEQKPGP